MKVLYLTKKIRLWEINFKMIIYMSFCQLLQLCLFVTIITFIIHHSFPVSIKAENKLWTYVKDVILTADLI